MKSDYGLYIHLPFCKAKCSYCDFYSITNYESILKPYLKAIKRESDFFDKATPIKTVFIGGGNPGALPISELKRVFCLIQTFNIGNAVEFSVEINPDDLTEEFMDLCRAYNVTRISMGAQSFNTKILNVLGRKSNAKIIYNALDIIKNYDEINLNIDLIFNTPLQTFDEFKKDIDELIGFHPQSLSAYSLILSEGTKLTSMVENGYLPLPDENVFMDMYKYLHFKTNETGYSFYEVSNFALPDKECIHNENYWQLGEYIGIGASASGYLQGVRYSNYSDTEKYIKSVFSGNRPCSFDILTPEKKYVEYVMLGLRTRYGINIDKLKRLAFNIGEKVMQKALIKIDELIKMGYLHKTNKAVVCTLSGFTVLDELILSLLYR